MPLVLTWLTGTVYAFWWFQVRDLRAFDQEQMAEFQGEQLAARLNTLLDVKAAFGDATSLSGRTVVFHFWNPDCQCNRFNTPHVKQIIDSYRDRGISFLTVIPPKAGQNDRQAIKQAREIFGVPAVVAHGIYEDNEAVPSASPAAAVITADRQLAYFGPYSEGAACGPSGGAFVENTLDALIRGDTPQESNTLAFGCFCQWADTHPSQVI